MEKLLNTIQAALAQATAGNVVDVAPILSTAGELTAEEVEMLQTSIANPKDAATRISDLAIMLKNSYEHLQQRQLQSMN